MRREQNNLKVILDGIKTEIIAGSVLRPKNDGDRAWNDANRRSAGIIDNYISGKGLFQLPTKGNRRKS